MSRAKPIKQVSRADGQVTQTAILDATLILIVKEGIRNVKYQSVAELAGVANSAVAYYFNDIPNLIQHAFRYYIDKYAEDMAYVRQVGNRVLAGLPGIELTESAGKLIFIESYVNALMQVLASEQLGTLEYMLLDRIFRNETLTNLPLYRLLKQQDQLDIDAIQALFEKLNTASPEEDAIQFMSLLWFLGERLVQERYKQQQKQLARKLLTHALHTMLQV